MCNKGGGDHQSCCEKCKDCCGRIPIVSMIAACIMVASFTMLAVCVELGLKPLDDAFKILRQFDKDYEEERAYIVTMMRVGAFTSYGFVWLFLFVAFISSGRNRDILKGRKCCRSHIVCILILTMILMCFIYVITLISVSMIGVPLMVASMTLKGCEIVMDSATGVFCLNPIFLGSLITGLCRGTKLLDRLCDDMIQVTEYAWACYFSLFAANIGMVLGLAVSAANFAYVKMEAKYGGLESEESLTTAELNESEKTKSTTTKSQDEKEKTKSTTATKSQDEKEKTKSTTATKSEASAQTHNSNYAEYANEARDKFYEYDTSTKQDDPSENKKKHHRVRRSRKTRSLSPSAIS